VGTSCSKEQGGRAQCRADETGPGLKGLQGPARGERPSAYAPNFLLQPGLPLGTVILHLQNNRRTMQAARLGPGHPRPSPAPAMPTRYPTAPEHREDGATHKDRHKGVMDAPISQGNCPPQSHRCLRPLGSTSGHCLGQPALGGPARAGGMVKTR